MIGRSRAGSRASRVAITAVLFVACGACSGARTTNRAAAIAVTDTVRVLTYNTAHGLGEDERVDLERTAAVIREARPDLVALQEVDSATLRTAGVDQAARLGELTGLEAHFARAMPYDSGAYGNAVLSRLPVDAFAAHPLPADTGHEPRVVAQARVTLPRTGRTILFMSTHLDQYGDATVRQAQIDRIVALFEGDSLPPTILAGDLNDTPDSAPVAKLLRLWMRAAGPDPAPTYPAPEPVRRIDYVLYSADAGIRVLSERVIAETVASDHRPVLVVLEVARPR